MARYVWRVEHKDTGKGPYTSWNIETYMWQTQNHNELPEPDEEGLPIWGYFCAFRNRKQLHRWFKKRELQKLKTLGFKIVRRTAKVVKEGRKQVVFKPYKKKK